MMKKYSIFFHLTDISSQLIHLGIMDVGKEFCNCFSAVFAKNTKTGFKAILSTYFQNKLTK